MQRTLIIYALGLLPALNAGFDYLPYGLTISLIQKGRKTNGLVLFAIDAFCAVVILIGLGVSFIALVSGINAFAAPAQLLDLDKVLSDLRDPEKRGGYTWLYLTAFTTLIPTLVHMIVCALSAFTWIPYRAKVWLADATLAEDDDMRALFATGASSVYVAAYCALVAGALFGAYLFVMWGLTPFALWVLDWVEWIARGLRLF